MKHPDDDEIQRTSFRLVLLSFINRIFLWVLTRFSHKAGNGPFWRLCSRFLFLEMQARQWRGPLSAKPYVLFEQYFANTPEHLERFQNFVAGNGILADLLRTNWFEYLSIKDRVPVTSLFRRIYKAENVWLSYRNRPAIVEQVRTLENVDQDSLPPSIFIVPVPAVGTAMRLWLKITVFFTAISNAIDTGIRKIFRGIALLFSYCAFTLLAIPLALISTLGFASPNIQAAIARVKLKMLATIRPHSNRFGHHLSRYETLFAADMNQTKKMAGFLKTSEIQRLISEDRIDNLAFKDRVLVTSLLRRTSSVDPELASLLKSKNLDEAIKVKSQRDVAQLTRPTAQQKNEWKSFKKLNSARNQKSAQKQDQTIAPTAPNNPRRQTRATPTSESILQKQGWFTPLHKADLAFATILRERAFNDAAAHVNNEETFTALSPQMKTKAGAIMAILQEPIIHQAGAAEIDPSLLVPMKVSNRTKRRQAADAFSAAESVLYPNYEGETASAPLACWTNLQHVLNDDTEFSYAAEVLTAAYSNTAYNRVTDRTVSFDTFLITRLEEILDKIKLWVDWDDCPNSAIVAYAYAAAAVGDYANFDFFVKTLEDRPGIPSRFVLNLRDSYFNTGVHKLDAVLSPSTSATEDTQLREITPGKKYLCLVEMGARVQALRQIEGVTADNLLCGPVAPTDAVKFPPSATLVQAEDFIPMYSAEDMKIGAEVDRLTEHYLNTARDALKQSGASELYEDAIEVTHATIYFALYRDAISATICEKLVATAADYDGVILLTKSGQILGNMIAPAIEAVGRENIYLSLGSHRAPEFFSALTKMRASAKSVKSTPKAIEASDDWMSAMGGWISDSMNFHGRAMQHVKDGAYSIMTLEHINGYYDSYQALIRQGLPHSHVELFTSAANTQLNDHIIEGGFAPYEQGNELRHCVMRPRTPDARPWVTPFANTLRSSFENFDSPYLPAYHEMILERAQAVFSQRLPQIMDAVSYFRARFAKGLPDYVFTGPNQHMISRAAAYCAKASGVPVYDFLILANTNHPRYRPIVADYAYLYDPWYKEIYQSFFGMKEEQLRTAGPLFEYSERLQQEPNDEYAAPPGKTHIVFFSQSANFDNSKLMLESICQATKDRKDIYITVKLHPHESPANVERYTQIAAENGVKGNIHVFHKGDAVALLNQADLVVQSFSNVGLDALLLKKPVITFKPKTDLEARIFLYEKDIGYVVSTKRTLTNKIKRFLTNPDDRKAMKAIAEKFAAENDHFLRGENAARVMRSVQEDVIRFKMAREQ